MTDEGARSVSRLTDPKALRALAHPLRLSLLGMLRTEGALTATRASQLLGESVASCSFHLRQLAKYGLVEEAEGGQGRNRPWRATAMFTDVPSVTDNPELAAASGLFRSMIAERYFEKMTRWLEAEGDEPAEWQEAAGFNDVFLYLTAAELTELREQVEGLISRYLNRLVKPALRPPGARLVSYIQAAVPEVGPATGHKAAGGDDG